MSLKVVNTYKNLHSKKLTFYIHANFSTNCLKLTYESMESYDADFFSKLELLVPDFCGNDKNWSPSAKSNVSTMLKSMSEVIQALCLSVKELKSENARLVKLVKDNSGSVEKLNFAEILTSKSSDIGALVANCRDRNESERAMRASKVVVSGLDLKPKSPDDEKHIKSVVEKVISELELDSVVCRQRQTARQQTRQKHASSTSTCRT